MFCFKYISNALSESGFLNISLMSFFWYFDSVQQFLGSYKSHVLVVDPAMWALLRPRAKNIEYERIRGLSPSSANIVCEKEHCPTDLFFVLFWRTRRLLGCIELFSILCFIGIAMFYYQFDVIFPISLYCLAVLGSSGGHVFVVEALKWDKLCRRAENFRYET